MRTRADARTIPDTDRYWCVDLPDKGAHHFRFPSYATAARIVEWLGDAAVGSLAGGVLYNGAIIGAFWWHRAEDLAAKMPLRGTDGEIDAFADAVLDELQEEGYSIREIEQMAKSCDQQIADWMRERVEAIQASRDFTEAPG